MGKSRLADEVAKQIFTIPVCLSNREKCYPPADSVARDNLVEIANIPDKQEREYKFIEYFANLFANVTSKLKGMSQNYPRGLKNLPELWRKYLYSNDFKHRKDLFSKCSPKRAYSEDDRKAMNTMKSDLFKAVKGLRTLIEELTGVNAPHIILSIDEADTLMFSKGSNVKKVGQYGALLMALSSENIPSVYVTVQSTAGYVFDLLPPASSINAEVENMETRLRVPFIELDFDVNVAPVQESQFNLQTVCTTEFITRFGRSLFKAAYENGLKGNIVEFAIQKFLGSFQRKHTTSSILVEYVNDAPNFDAQTIIAACLDVRFLLSSDTYRLLPALGEQKQVSSNLRLILTIPNHRKYMHTGYGSEPLVAEAASQLLRLDSTENMVKAIEIADSLFGAYLSAKGDRGEFVARLLLTAAHDRAARLPDRQYATSHTDTQLLYTKPVGVLDFLKCLFAKEHHPNLLGVLPTEQRAGELTLEEAFSNAYVHFTHYCRADKKSLCHLQFAWQGLVRSAAIQCCQTQEGVDIIIPIAFASEGERPEFAMLGKSSVSAIVIQVKDRIHKRPVNINMEKLNFFKDEKGFQLNLRPFISITLELGLVPKDVSGDKVFIVTTSRGRDATTRLATGPYNHPQYDIRAHGFHGVYEGISEKEGAIMQKILHTSSFDKEYKGSSITSIYNFKSHIAFKVGVVAVAPAPAS